ncbi:unnamed protein product [Phaeothamnion confervicola]
MADKARVALVTVQQPCMLLEALLGPIGLPPGTALELVALGAVYYACRLSGRPKMARIMDPAQPLRAGARVRVHLEPKRYPACQRSDWPERVAWQDDEYVVLEKPAGVVCMAHVSNWRECLHRCASEALGTELLLLHRIDQWTTGLVS